MGQKSPTLGTVVTIAASLAAMLAVGRSPGIPTADRATDDMTNAKQLALAVVIYSADADERFPLAYAATPRGGYRPDARFTLTSDAYQSGEYNWATAIYPYCKSAVMFRAVGAPRVAVDGPPDAKLPAVGHAYNGLLHGFLAESVVAPADTLMFSQSYGFVNLEGWAMANPAMNCVERYPCTYVPPQKNCGGTEPGTTSRLASYDATQYATDDLADGTKGARSQVAAFADGHAERIRFDGVPSEPYAAATFPWSRLDRGGKALSYWADAFGCHPQLFRPDYDPAKDRNAREIAK